MIEKHLVARRARFLDRGCGGGQYVFSLADRHSLDAWGVEYEAVKVAEGRRHPRHGHRIAQGGLLREGLS